MRIVFILLFCFSTATAQTVKDSAVVKEIKDLPATQPFDTVHTYHRVTETYVYIISNNDMYSLFGYETAMKYRDFDFGNYHILGLHPCEQCKEWIWVTRENKKAFTEIPSATMPGHVDATLPAGRRSFFGDTIIKASSDTARTNWYTHGHGDCYARFTYAVFVDRFHPVLLLKEWNYYGGCRAAGFWDYTISFKMPPGILQKTKSTILVEKYRD